MTAQAWLYKDRCTGAPGLSVVSWLRSRAHGSGRDQMLLRRTSSSSSADVPEVERQAAQTAHLPTPATLRSAVSCAAGTSPPVPGRGCPSASGSMATPRSHFCGTPACTPADTGSNKGQVLWGDTPSCACVHGDSRASPGVPSGELKRCRCSLARPLRATGIAEAEAGGSAYCSVRKSLFLQWVMASATGTRPLSSAVLRDGELRVGNRCVRRDEATGGRNCEGHRPGNVTRAVSGRGSTPRPQRRVLLAGRRVGSASTLVWLCQSRYAEVGSSQCPGRRRGGTAAMRSHGVRSTVSCRREGER